MAFINNHLLSLILFIPTAAALILLALPAQRVKLIRWFAFGASLIPLALAVFAWTQFQSGKPGFQFEEQVTWYAALSSSYHLGIDGISLPLILLTALLTPLSVLASFSITERVKPFMFLFLLLETGMLGVFMSLDLLLFFVFWEVGLIPMYFLIAQWGSANRNYASLKFILYTMAGSLGLLLSIQMIGVVTGTYDLVKLFQVWPGIKEGASLFGLPVETVKAIAFWAFVIAFAIKVPVWPFHTWLPDAHTEAPTGGSMILAGVLLKLGAYGFLRLILPLFPEQAYLYSGWLAALGALAIILGALSAFGQTDFKRLVAYSSINHMGFVVLGIAVAARATGTMEANIALNGAVLQMVNHGLSAAGMFFLVGVVYERTHTRNLNDLGGFFTAIPVYGSILVFTAMGSLGLPGMGGFVSEFMVVRGAWPTFVLATTLSLIGLFFTGAYILKALKQVLHGPISEKWHHHLAEINFREVVVMTPLMALMLVIGFWPASLLEVINRAIVMLKF
jgi:NADH-quinone oxidoreductase subunit M